MPKGIRPSQDKVRKALFDILGNIEGLSFLELFAGTGAVGIEALSYGAKEVVFVEKDRKCVKAIKENLSVLGFSPACRQAGVLRVLGLEVFEAISKLVKEKVKFDIVFLDPPYYQGLAKKTLQTLSDYDILAPNGFIIVQHFKKDILPDAWGDLISFRQARYGDTVLTFYKKVTRNQNFG